MKPRISQSKFPGNKFLPLLKTYHIKVIALLLLVALGLIYLTALSLLGVILISISGYLGGELVFRHGVAVDIESGVR